MDAKKALEESGGDIEKAIEHLEESGAIKAAKRQGRETSEGVVSSYIHHNKKLGALVAVQCETDFVARTDEFQELANDLAMQVAAIDPLFVAPDMIPDNELEKQRNIFKKEVVEEGKPEEMQDKIVEGKMEKWYKEVCLLNQEFLKNEDQTIKELIEQKIAKTGENIAVKGFSRWSL